MFGQNCLLLILCLNLTFFRYLILFFCFNILLLTKSKNIFLGYFIMNFLLFVFPFSFSNFSLLSFSLIPISLLFPPSKKVFFFTLLFHSYFSTNFYFLIPIPLFLLVFLNMAAIFPNSALFLNNMKFHRFQNSGRESLYSLAIMFFSQE